jgi:hypothetical protein
MALPPHLANGRAGAREMLAMSLVDRDESMFPFFRQGTAEASTIGSWARAAFLPPDTFQALVKSLIGEWLEAGTDPTAAASAGAVALAAYRGEEAPLTLARTDRRCLDPRNQA